MDTKKMDEKRKQTVAILFGGQSAEHDVSLKSAEALYKNLDKKKFIPIFIYISREDGKWHILDEKSFVEEKFVAHVGYSFLPWLNLGCPTLDADIYFPMLHGPNGEDGKIQSMLELVGKPYVGADSTSSLLAMDKLVAKTLFRSAGLNVVDYLHFDCNVPGKINKEITLGFGYPVFIKPSSMGSSVGISRVDGTGQLKTALDLAFRYDSKVLVEKALNVRELEISVMGNEQPMISRPGELVPANEFYDYQDKYLDGKTTFHIPAKLDPDMEKEVCRIAGAAYKALFLNGMSRVDLFVEKKTNKIYVNEINTIPGFTEISMFPKLWGVQGISFGEMVTRLIEYGFQYHRKNKVDVNRA